jgi:hypothetical protein
MMNTIRKLFSRRKRNPAEILLFAIISFLVIISCSPAYPAFLSVDQIIINESSAYLIVSDEESMWIECNDPSCYHYLISENNGSDWASTPWREFIYFEEVNIVNYPVIECVQDASNVCYRIDGQDIVEISYDGGESWDIEWRIPIGRKRYMESEGFWEKTGIFPDYPDPMENVDPPKDLKIISNNGSHKVIVAMGNGGLLIKGKDGSWSRRGVTIISDFKRSAIPKPYKASDFQGISDSVGTELFFLSIVSIIMLTVIYNIGKKELIEKNNWQEFETKEELDRMMEISVFSSLGFMFSSWILFVLWGYWIIPIYEISWALTVVIGGVLIFTWWKKKKKIVENFQGTIEEDA